LVNDIRLAGTRLIYSVDDNFLDLPAEREDWPTEDHLRVVKFFLCQADGVVVTTSALKERFSEFNQHIVVVPNALDERLLGSAAPRVISRFAVGRKTGRWLNTLRRRFRQAARRKSGRMTVGYMGTLTHDGDLMLIAPALRRLWQRHQQEVQFQILGVMAHAPTLEALNFPVQIINIEPYRAEYPIFIPWFSSYFDWDIAIAPLRDTPFTRCKSDIKFLDYSAIGAAGIYSRVPAYETTVQHLHTGWLAENDVEAWEEALETLLTNKTLRLKLSQNAKRYLYKERILAHRTQDWLIALEYFLHSAPLKGRVPVSAITVHK
jgi:glycosyltransferase involved in cell wall biosynthesis